MKRFDLNIADVIEEKRLLLLKFASVFSQTKVIQTSASSYTADGDENNTKPVSFSSLSLFLWLFSNAENPFETDNCFVL